MIVVAAGGDGTINAVAQAALGRDCTFGVLPKGTFNYFSRTHGIPADTGEGMKVVLQGSAQPVQVGLVNNHLSATALHPFAVVTHFGDRPVLFAIGILVTFLLWRARRKPLAIGWAVTLAGNAVLNPMLKQFFERLRPLNEHGVANALGWSFPSGHASGAMVTYGMLAYVAVRALPSMWHLPVVLGLISLVLSVGFSRIFLQVHFASDVAAGFASGLAWLSLCILTIELIEHYRRIN